jgi:hypothetical protein
MVKMLKKKLHVKKKYFIKKKKTCFVYMIFDQYREKEKTRIINLRNMILSHRDINVSFTVPQKYTKIFSFLDEKAQLFCAVWDHSMGIQKIGIISKLIEFSILIE